MVYMCVTYRIMVNCAKLKKETCPSYPLFCKWERGKGCKSLRTQRRTKTKAVSSPKEKSAIKKFTLIDSGTYGCVINPPVSHSDNISMVLIPYKNEKTNDIAKLYKDGVEEFQSELEILEKVKSIDPNNEFTTELKGAMILNRDTIRDPELVSCLTKKNKNKSRFYHQIILENGGVRIDKEYSLSYVDFIFKFEVFLKGMLKIQSRNLVHLDIKPANVLISSEKISLIDFGLMTKTRELFTEDNTHILGYLEYPYYPPEFYIAYMIIKYGKIVPVKLDKLFSQSFLTDSQPLKMKYKRGVQEFMNEMKKTKPKEILTKFFTPELALKSDVFSLAYILVAFNKKINFTNQTDKDFIDLLYNKCIEPNPFKRISLKDLYELVVTERSKLSPYTSADTFRTAKSASSSIVSISSSSPESVVGGKMKRTECDKVPVKILRYKMDKRIKHRS